MTAPVVHSLREQIREHILEGIISGRWQPGERIVERRIATELEVSQTPVREALRELESLRLIESAPNKGVRVRNLTAADLEESYPVRAGLEAIAAELAAARLAEDCSRWSRTSPRCTRPTGWRTGRGRCGTPWRSTGSWCVPPATRCCCTRGRGWGSRCSRRCRYGGWGRCSSPMRRSTRSSSPRFRRRDPLIADLVKAHVLGCAPRA
ncbi:GntR family transcriptional regulator [Streptomyces heliomycini]